MPRVATTDPPRRAKRASMTASMPASMTASMPASMSASKAKESELKHAQVASAIERWFAVHARDLPWRRKRSGYSALVSEIMLQQTQVARVLEKYEAFVARFPTAAALARAEESEVLAAWQGLGYYRRARFLHRAAQVIVSEHGGRVPIEAVALRGLPGIGRYSAGSIASIVSGRREPIVDGNVSRVFQRLAGRRGAVNEKANERWAWEQAQRYVDASSEPGKANEGLMELGGRVCTPAAPRCGECPLRGKCASHAQGIVGEIPAPKPRAVKPELVLLSVRVVRSDGAVLLEQRANTGLWARMWQPPTIEMKGAAALSPSRSPSLTPRVAARRAGLALTLTRVGEIPVATSSRAVRIHLFAGRVRGKGRAFEVKGRRFVMAHDLHQYAMSNAAKRLL